MITGIPPLDILLTKGVYVFAFDFGRYLIAASVTAVIVWMLRRVLSVFDRLLRRRIAAVAE